jgi:hypothetical protein
VAYGRWMLEHGRLPVHEPFLPLAAGRRVVNYCWLSQAIFALVERRGGAEALSNLFAVVVLARYLVLTRAGLLQTGRLGLSMAAMLAAFGMSESRNGVMRPEIFAALCFHLLLWLLAAADPGALAASRGGRDLPGGCRASSGADGPGPGSRCSSWPGSTCTRRASSAWSSWPRTPRGGPSRSSGPPAGSSRAGSPATRRPAAGWP